MLRPDRLHSSGWALISFLSYSLTSDPRSTTLPTIISTSLDSARHNCTKHKLTPKLWNDLQLDEYMEKYPGGNTLNLQAYADQVNATNFICGIGQPCNAGQLCSSAAAPDWYVLVAAQNWNQFMNMVYTGLSFGSITINGQVTDLCPPRSALPVQIATWLGLVGSFTTIIPTSAFPGIGVWVWVFIQGLLYTTASEIWFYHNVIRAPPDVQSGYTKWTNFAWMLTILEDKAQEKIHDYTQKTLRSGISTNDGMFGVLKNGTFLQRAENQSQFDIQTNFEQILKLKLLNTILRAQEKCVDQNRIKGLSDKNILSYCGEDGVMMNIVQAKGTKTKKKIFGGKLIQTKYGFSTAFLTKTAWNCQKKYGKYEFDPYQNSTLPTDVSADCLFNLPVCDCNQIEIKQKRERGVRTAKACMEAGVPVHTDIKYNL